MIAISQLIIMQPRNSTVSSSIKIPSGISLPRRHPKAGAVLDPSEDAFDSVHVGVGLGSSVVFFLAFLKNDP